MEIMGRPCNKYALILALVIALDLVTTTIGLLLGIEEANPFVGTIGVYVFSIIIMSFFVFMAFYKSVMYKWIELLIVLPIIVRSIIVITNIINISLLIWRQ